MSTYSRIIANPLHKLRDPKRTAAFRFKLIDYGVKKHSDLSLETRDSRTRAMKLNNHPSYPPAGSVDCVTPSPAFDGSHSMPSREEIISYIFKFLGIESRSISSVAATFIVILYCPPFLFFVIIIQGLEHIRHIAVFERTFQSTLVSPVLSP